MLNVGNQSSKIKFKQSANTLFNFMPQFEFLKKALVNKAMYPRYYEENIEYLDLYYGDKQIERVAFPMLCFCDIKLHTLSDHIDGDHGYGSFGIGLDKKWCMEKGIQPIDYINHTSTENGELSNVLNEGTKLLFSQRYEDTYDNFFNYLLSKLLYTKPLYGKMKKGNSYISKNFHDEREWRYIPEKGEDNEFDLFLNNVTKPDYMSELVLKNYSDALNSSNNHILKLEINAVNYIFIKDESYLEDLLKIIADNYDSKTALLLASKVVVYDKIKGDW